MNSEHTHCPLCGSCGAGRQQSVSSQMHDHPVYPQDNIVFPPSQPKKRRGRPPGSKSSGKSVGKKNKPAKNK